MFDFIALRNHDFLVIFFDELRLVLRIHDGQVGRARRTGLDPVVLAVGRNDNIVRTR